MKVAVVGSRSITNIDISQYIPGEATEIISGGARGVDTLAAEYAQKNNIPLRVFRPDYNAYGKSAPILRNVLIVESADIIIAIWDTKSSGTKYVINHALKVGKPIKVYNIT